MSSNPPGGPNFWQQAWQQITNSYGFFTNPIGGVLPLAQSSLTFANPSTPGGQLTAKEAGAINTGVGNVTGAKLPGINIGVNIGGILKVAFGGLLILLALALAFLPEIGEAAAVAAGAPELAPAVGGALRGKPRAGVKRSANTLVDAMNRRAADRRARQVEARTDIRRSERKTGKLAPRETYEAAGLPDLYERRAAGTEPLSGQPRPRKPRVVRQPRQTPAGPVGPVSPRPAPTGSAGPTPEEPEGVKRERAKARREAAWQRMEGTLDDLRQPPPARRLADQPLTAPSTSTFEPGERLRRGKVPGMLNLPTREPVQSSPLRPAPRAGTRGGTLGVGPGATLPTPTPQENRERERGDTLREQADTWAQYARNSRKAADQAYREGDLLRAQQLRDHSQYYKMREILTRRAILGQSPGGES